MGDHWLKGCGGGHYGGKPTVAAFARLAQFDQRGSLLVSCDGKSERYTKLPLPSCTSSRGELVGELIHVRRCLSAADASYASA